MTVHALNLLPRPLRGDIWQAETQTGAQPVAIVSADLFNESLVGLVIAVPVSFTDRKSIAHIRTRPPEGGLQQPGFIQCELLHWLNRAQLSRQLGALHPATFAQVEDCLKLLLSF